MTFLLFFPLLCYFFWQLKTFSKSLNIQIGFLLIYLFWASKACISIVNYCSHSSLCTERGAILLLWQKIFWEKAAKTWITELIFHPVMIAIKLVISGTKKSFLGSRCMSHNYSHHQGNSRQNSRTGHQYLLL